MWICSTLGFFSVVESDRRNGEFLVRARCTEDLVILKTAAGLGNEILILPGTDYAARIVVTREQLGKVFQVLEKSIDYSNFKDRIRSTPHQADKHHTYGDVWLTLFRYQQERSSD